MTVRDKGIIAYGTQTDRKKLAVIARLAGLSNSEMLIQLLRDKYAAVVGDEDPDCI